MAQGAGAAWGQGPAGQAGRRRGVARLLAAGVVAAGLVAAAWPVPALEIVDPASGHVHVRLAVAEATPVRLAYLHSLYRAPGSEEFVVRDGRLELVRLRSPSEAVLEYYARPEPIRLAPDGYAIDVAGPAYAELPVLASATGQRTVHCCGRVVALASLAGDGARVVLRVAQRPRVVVLWAHLR